MILTLLALAAAQAGALPSSPDPMPPRRPRTELRAPSRPAPAPRVADDPAEARYRQCTQQIRSDAEAAVAAEQRANRAGNPESRSRPMRVASAVPVRKGERPTDSGIAPRRYSSLWEDRMNHYAHRRPVAHGAWHA